ncbi:MAG: hypothetical protein ABI141_19195 [Gemmatimonadaceae bacterium]
MPPSSHTSAARTRHLTIIAQDPSVVDRHGRIIRAQAAVPAEDLADGPWGHRFQVIDFDASTNALLRPLAARAYAQAGDGSFPDPFADVDDAAMLASPEFHAQNVYAIAMRTLSRFEQALGRRVSWGVQSHQIKLVPHAFADANAFYAPKDQAIVFGYCPTAIGDGTVFACLSHDVVAHETTHALVDGLRHSFLLPSSPDQAAFHEGFADIVAILSVFSLREVVEGILDSPRAGMGRLNGRVGQRLIDRKQISAAALKRSALLGLADQMGAELSGVRGSALRQSASLKPRKGILDEDEFLEPHRRGEVLVAAVLNAFVDVWAKRIDSLRQYGSRMNVLRVAEEGCAAADYLLTMAIRALDYAPPVHLGFSDFLSAMLTADYEIRPDDGIYEFRRLLHYHFASFGIAPASIGLNAAPGLWTPVDNSALSFERSHFESMQRDPDEMFAFVWENRDVLHFFDGAYTKVRSVRPCLRVAPDGFPLRETVAEVSQRIDLSAGELGEFGIRKPLDMADATPITLNGGSTLVFDEYGRLKYEIHNLVSDAVRQGARIQYLWDSAFFEDSSDLRRPFAALHRRRSTSAAITREGW